MELRTMMCWVVIYLSPQTKIQHIATLITTFFRMGVDGNLAELDIKRTPLAKDGPYANIIFMI